MPQFMGNREPTATFRPDSTLNMNYPVLFLSKQPPLSPVDFALTDKNIPVHCQVLQINLPRVWEPQLLKNPEGAEQKNFCKIV